jgi:hypothetical protein
MNTKERCIIELQILKAFFETYKVDGWVDRTNNTIKQISNTNQDLKIILKNYFGQGMGSFHDLWISEDNGFKLLKSEKETNDELFKLAENLLMIKQKLK